MQHQLLQTGCSKAKFANTTTTLTRPLDDGPIGGQVSEVLLYLYSRLAEKHRRRYTGKQLLWFIFISVGETRGDLPPSLKNLGKIRIFPAATRKYLSKIRFFREVTGTIRANQFFYAPQTNYFCRTKFRTAEKWSRYEVKIFFKDHYFFGRKIEKLEADWNTKFGNNCF